MAREKLGDVLKALQDVEAPETENIGALSDNAATDEKVIVRQVKTKAYDDDEEDGTYEDDEDLDDATKKIVKGGKVVKKKVSKKAHGGLTPAQYKARVANLKKARKLAHTPAAEKKRRKSMQARRKFNIEEQKFSDADESLNARDLSPSKFDFEEMGNQLRIFAQQVLMDNYELSDEQHETLDEILVNAFDCEVEDGKLFVTIPVWSVSDEVTDLDDYELASVEFDLQDGITFEDVIEGIVSEDEGDFNLAAHLLGE